MRCMNMKVFVGLAAAGLAVIILVPGAGRSFGPLIIAAACPLSMVGMMVAMGKGSSKKESAPTPRSSPLAPPDRETEVAELRARLACLEDERDATTAGHG